MLEFKPKEIVTLEEKIAVLRSDEEATEINLGNLRRQAPIPEVRLAITQRRMELTDIQAQRTEAEAALAKAHELHTAGEGLRVRNEAWRSLDTIAKRSAARPEQFAAEVEPLIDAVIAAVTKHAKAGQQDVDALLVELRKLTHSDLRQIDQLMTHVYGAVRLTDHGLQNALHSKLQLVYRALQTGDGTDPDTRPEAHKLRPGQRADQGARTTFASAAHYAADCVRAHLGLLERAQQRAKA